MPEEVDDVIPEVTTTDLLDTAIAVGIVVAAVVLSRLAIVVLSWGLRRGMPGGYHGLAESIIRATRGPVTWLIIIQGLFLALRYPAYLERYAGLIGRLWVAAVVVLVVVGVQRGVTHVFAWYQARSEQAGVTRMDPRTYPVLRRAINLVVAVLGGLLILDVLGLEITPLIAGLGIGGLAVALALQPVLGNIFASSYMLSDASIRVGDFIEIEGGPVGSVEHIGWRATRIRSFDNNIVLVPNSTLVDSTLTNYSSTDLQADARVVFGVAYEEDLARVEAVVTDELVRLRDEFEASVEDYEPIVRFQEFGDSNITILVKLRALTWGDSFMLRHLMVRRIHGRLAREGITINYPARRLLLQEGDASALDQFVRRAGESHPEPPPGRLD